MTNSLRRLISGVLAIAVILSGTPFVYAQDIATGSAEASISADFRPAGYQEASEAGVFPDSSPHTILDDISEATVSALPVDPFISPMPQAPSATLFLQARIRNLSKKTYRGGESVDVVIENAISSPVSIRVVNNRGEKVAVPVKVAAVGEALAFSLVPPASFRPGFYRVIVTDEKGNETVQDFSWGVLALNPDRSRYVPGQTADIAIAVLDDEGYVDCRADVTLKITAPDSTVIFKKTADNSILITGMCYKKEETTIPDYRTSFVTEQTGVYGLELTAISVNGSRTITDRIPVESELPFDISRNAPTRIYPPLEYPVGITVTANRDFRGRIVETVPEAFAISPEASAAAYSEVLVVSEGTVSEKIEITKPFTGEHPVTLGFGQEVLDNGQKERYRTFGLAGHDGVDFDLPVGTPVFSADSGEVILAQDSSYGLTVVIRHSWGQTYYGHLSELKVSAGDPVKKYQPIGLSGATGIATDPHLHFGMKLKRHEVRNGYYGKTDPLPYLTGVAETSVVTLKKISWDVDLKTGETVTLGYRFRAPNLFPWLFLLGPAQLTASIDPDQKELPQSSASSAFVLGVNDSHSEMEIVYEEARQWQIASDATTYITASNASWPVPSDWNSANNKIEVVGAGGGGATGGSSQAASGGGGGGGAYAREDNVALTPSGTVTVVVGTATGIGGTGGDSYFCNATTNCTSIADTAVKAGAKGGGGATGATKGTGGATLTSVGTVKNAGGDGANGGTASLNGGGGGGGGGGAAGMNAAGNNGSPNTDTTGGNGGQGDGTAGGTGGNGASGGNPGGTGGTGNPGTEWSASYGSGGGGGGGGGGATTRNAGGPGGPGGIYGAGGGGGGAGGKSGGTGGSGASGYQGLIVVYYVTGPTTAEQLRHGNWFSSGIEQGFTY